MRYIATLLVFVSSLALHAVDVPASVVRVIDGDTVETSEGTVRLLWIDTPESKSNRHGLAMPEGKAASEYLAGRLPKASKVTLWGPKDTLEKDRYGRLLAVVWLHQEAGVSEGEGTGTPAELQVNMNINLTMIRAGWTPYFRKYGQASNEKAHSAYVSAQEIAKEAKVGAWGTIPQWMTDKANETTAPKK